MEIFNNLSRFLASLIGTLPAQVHTYKETGTGSFVPQILVAAILVLLLYRKTVWRYVRVFFSRLKSKSEKPDSLMEDMVGKNEPKRRQLL